MEHKGLVAGSVVLTLGAVIAIGLMLSGPEAQTFGHPANRTGRNPSHRSGVAEARLDFCRPTWYFTAPRGHNSETPRRSD